MIFLSKPVHFVLSRKKSTRGSFSREKFGAPPNRETVLARNLAVGERESKVLVGRVRLHVVRDDADLEGLDVGDDVGVGRRLEHAVQAATAESQRELVLSRAV